jgi:hypothetical protein
MTKQTDDLAAACAAAGIRTSTDFHVLALRLSSSEAVLYRLLADAPAPVEAFELRRAAEGRIANVSLTARTLNAKLAAADDPRRVVNAVMHGGRAGSVSRWSLAEPGPLCEAAS